MNTKFYFGLLAAAALSMTACSNENEPNNGGENTIDPQATQYMAVRISNIGEGGTRAAAVGSPDEFEGANGTEGTITKENLYFLFFDGKGNAFTLAYANVNGDKIETNMVKPSELAQDETDGADKSLTGVLVLGKPTGEGYVGQTPSQMLCIANPRTTVMDELSLANKNLTSVLATITKTPDSGWDNESGVFLMTNSAYVDDANKLVRAVDVTGCIKTSADLAKQNPAKIYLERLTAKVRTIYDDSYTVKQRNNDNSLTDAEFVIDNGNKQKLNVVVNGWQLANTAEQANAFKVLTPSDYTDWGWTWNDAERHRSYWAESNQGGNLKNKTFDIYDNDQFTRGKFDPTKATENIQYCYENTGFTDAKATNRTVGATGIVVKATVQTADGNAIDMLKWAGTYYTSTRLKEKVVETYKAEHPESTITTANVEFIESNEAKNTWKAEIRLDNGTTQDMSYMYDDMLYWKNGITSYYVNIEHLGGLMGVVRNHIYEYTINNIVGLGIPGNNPELPKETEQFLACYVRVLNWHVITNGVDLE